MRLSPRALLVACLMLVCLLLPTAALAEDGWLDETVDNTTGHNHVDIAVDVNGAPHIVYQESNRGTLRYAWRDAGTWYTEEVDDECSWTSIAVAPDGTLHIAYQKPSADALWHAWGTQGSWQTEEVGSGERWYGERCSIAVDSSGEPHIAFTWSNHAYYASHSDGGWNIETIPTWNLFSHVRMDLALGPDDEPFVARSYWWAPGQESIDLTVELLWREDGAWDRETFWQTLDPTSVDPSTLGYGYAAAAVDPFGVARIASLDMNDYVGSESLGLIESRLTSAGWAHNTLSASFGTWPDIAIDDAYWPVVIDRGESDGQPILALINMTNGGATTTTTWSIEGPLTLGAQLQALALDASGCEHIVAIDGNALRYLSRETPRALDEVVGPGTAWITNYTPKKGGWMGQDLHPRMLGDVNGDGMDDIVGFGNSATYVSLATGSGFSPQEPWITCYGPMAGGWSSNDRYPRMLGDVNGDGMEDIVAFGNKATFVSLSTGASFAPPTSWILLYGPSSGGWTSQDLYPRMLGDVNGDGRDDIVAFGNKATYVSLSTGTSFGGPLPWIYLYGPAAGGWSSYDIFPRMIADVDGDGLDDIVAFGNKTVYASASTGSSFGPPTSLGVYLGPESGGWLTQDGQTRLVGDMDGDGLTDIVACGQTATNWYRSTGSRLPSLYSWFYTIGRGWRSQNIYPRALADVNGDGKDDLVGFGSDGVYVQPAP